MIGISKFGTAVTLRRAAEAATELWPEIRLPPDVAADADVYHVRASLAGVVIDPQGRRPTYLIVRQDRFPRRGLVVPASLVVDVTPAGIRLDVTRETLGTFPDYQVTVRDCDGEPVGTVEGMLADPQSRECRRPVVRRSPGPGDTRLIPIELVADIRADAIHPQITSAHVDGLAARETA